MPKETELQEKMLAMNEALTLGLVRQHELVEAAETLNGRLQAEIIERRQAEAALRDSDQRYRTLFEMGPVAIYSCDASGRIQDFNGRAAELWGRKPAVGDVGEKFCGSFRMFHPDDSHMPHEQCPMADVLNGKVSEARDAEVQVERPDGSRATVMVNIRPLKNPQGEITGAINCFYDITERKAAEQRQLFLMNEVAHRSQNLLAVVRSIASRTLSGTRPLAEERTILEKRIQALARGQMALVSGGFGGAPVGEIIRLEFEVFSDRVRFDGPVVVLNRRAAQTFGLVVHELATNATKHGALSVAEGQIVIQWSIDGAGAVARFKFQWQEFNGPPVAPPTRKGFGRVLLERAVAQDFGTAPEMRFEPEGLRYEFDVPLVGLVIGAS